jgi:hypothetical protein
MTPQAGKVSLSIEASSARSDRDVDNAASLLSPLLVTVVGPEIQNVLVECRAEV